MSTLDLGTLVARLTADDTAMVNDLKRADGRLSGWAKGAGKLVAGGALAAGGVFAASLAKGINMDAANDKVAASMGLSAKESKRFGKLAGDLYADAYGESVDDVNAALVAVKTSIKGMANASDKDLKAATATAMDYAEVFDTDIAEAANSAGILVKEGLAGSSEEAFDLMTKTMQGLAPAMRGEMAPIINEYAKDFAAVGIDGDQAMQMISDASKGGAIQMDKLGDSVKEFKLLATDPAKFEIMDEIGLDSKKMSNDLLAGGATANAAMKTIAGALLKVKDPTKQATAAVELFGSPLEDMGKDTAKTTKFLQNLSGEKGMKGVAGAAAAMSEQVNDNAAESITKLKRKAEGLFLGLASWAIPRIEEFAKKMNEEFGPALKDAGKTFTEDILPKLQTFAGFIMDTVIPAISAVVGWLKDHSTTVKVAATVLGALIVVTQLHAAAMAVSAAGGMVAMIKGLKVVTTVTKAYTAVQWLMNTALLSSPLTWIVIAIAALALGLVYAWKKSETFRKIVTGAFDGVKGAAKAVWNWVKDNWPLLLAILTGPIGIAVGLIVKHWDKIKGGARAAKNFIVEKFTQLLDFIGGIKDTVAEKASGMWDGIKDAFRGMLNTIIGWWNGLSLTLPEVDTKIPGVGKVGGFKLQVHQIAQLAEGGYVPATPGGRIVNVAEGGQGEIVSPIPKMVEAMRIALAGERGNTHNEFNLTMPLAGSVTDNIRTARDLAASTSAI